MSDRRGPLLLLAAAAFASLGNFAFHAVGSRMLGPEAYSSLAALLALLIVVAVPVAAVQTAVTQSSAAAPDASAVETIERSTRAGIILILVGIGVALPLDRMLELHDPWGIALTAAWAAIACISAVAKGALLGRLRYTPVACSLVVGACARVVLGAMLIPALHVEGAMVATIAGEGIAALVALSSMRGDLLAFRARALRPRSSDASMALVSQLGLWVLAAITTIVGRRVLPAVDAGNFAAAATLTNAATFLPLAVATAFFPRFARDGSRRTFTQALTLAALLGAAVATGLMVVPSSAVHLLAGRSFTADPVVVGMLAAQSAIVGCVGVATFYLLARRQLSALLVWVGAATACAASLAVSGPRALAAVALVTAIMSAVGTISAAYRTDYAERSIDLGFALPDAECLLSVVVPSFNGGARLRPTIDALCRSLDATRWNYEVIVAIDGSTDGSVATLTRLPGHVIIDQSPINEGKGAALRRGFSRARGVYIGFIDGDGDIDVEIVRRLARACQRPTVWAAIASKHTEGADVNMSFARTTLSRMYRSLVRALFSLDVSDTQCGAKVFSRRGLERALPWTRENGFAFDVELLGLGPRLGLGEVVELPVRLHRPEGRTTVSALHALRTLEETLRVWSRVSDAPSEAKVG